MSSAPVDGVGIPAGPGGLTGERARLFRAAQDLEAVFFQQMLQAMREATPPGGLTPESTGEKVFRSMFDDEMARRAVAQHERGLAAALYRQLSRHLPPEEATGVVHPGPLEAPHGGTG